MSNFERLFIRRPQSIAGIELDAVLSETHESEVTPTSNPIQLRANSNQHAVIEPKRIQIVGYVTNTPFNNVTADIINSTTNLFGDSSDSSETRTALAYNELIRIQELRGLLDVQTRLKSYNDMLITSVTTVTDEDNYNATTLIISLQEMLIVSSESTFLSAEQLQEGRIRDQGSSESNKGTITPIESSETTRSSIAKKIAGFING